MTRSPYHEALVKNRAELVTLQRGMQGLIDMREKEISAATGEIAMLRKSKAAHGELITQIDLELNSKRHATEPSLDRIRDILAGEDA